MSKQKHNLSDSDDDSDADFCPESELKASNLEDGGSSNDEESDDSDDNLQEDNEKHKKNTDQNNKTKRSTRNTEEKNNLEKDIIESDEEDEKKRSDKLWASFLSDTNTETIAKKENSPKPASKSKTESADPPKRNDEKVSGENKTEKIKITEILDFAGEEIKMTKEVNQSDLKKSKTNSQIPNVRALPSMLKRPAASGLSTVLGQLGKKSKISVLQKTKLDWDSFKSKEGLNEDLKTFNKGKDGYLERQDFLERTDVRQFEIEKSLRQSKRSNN